MSVTEKMSATERPSKTKSSFLPSENVLLAVIAALILVLHVAGGVILTKASADATATTQEVAKPSAYD